MCSKPCAKNGVYRDKKQYMPQRTHNLISGKDKNTIKSGKYCKKVCTGD